MAGVWHCFTMFYPTSVFSLPKSSQCSRPFDSPMCFRNVEPRHFSSLVSRMSLRQTAETRGGTRCLCEIFFGESCCSTRTKHGPSGEPRGRAMMTGWFMGTDRFWKNWPTKSGTWGVVLFYYVIKVMCHNNSSIILCVRNVITSQSGWWLSHPSEKYELVSWDDENSPSIWKVIKFHGSKPPTIDY